MSNLHTKFRVDTYTLNSTTTKEASDSLTAQIPQGESVLSHSMDGHVWLNYLLKYESLDATNRDVAFSDLWGV